MSLHQNVHRTPTANPRASTARIPHRAVLLRPPRPPTQARDSLPGTLVLLTGTGFWIDGSSSYLGVFMIQSMDESLHTNALQTAVYLVVGAFAEDSSAVGVDGDGADNSANGAGAAYVFVRTGGSWTQQAYLKASNAEVNDQFGRSVAVSGDTVVVGAGAEDSSAVGVDGDGADNSANGAGAAYVFVRTGGSWTQQAYLKASNADAVDRFGRSGSVSVSGNTVVVGARDEDSGATGVNGDETDNTVSNAGAAYVFSGLTFPGIGDLVCVGTSNSTGFSGNLNAIGSRTALDNSLVLEVSRCPASTFGLMATSNSNGDPIQNFAIGEGSLCIANLQLGRFSVMMTDASGAASQAVDLAAIPTNLGPAAALPGDTYYFQFWHRDTVGGTATSNLTSAISVLFE